MPTKLALASFYTLFLLFGFLAAIIFVVMYYLDIISVAVLIIATILVNVFFWLVGPYITDFMLRIFYKMRFFSKADFQQLYPNLSDSILKIATNQRIPFPKMGIIDDDNPTAFTYGSGAFNARIIFTKGLFRYLETEEIESVISHELGHIVHRDFIVMTIANTVLQILYEISEILMRRRGGRDKKGNWLALIGFVAYVFYIIGFYVVLFLSRLREGYADEFSARVTRKPHNLSRALIKIAYGIMAKEENPQSMRLLESTRAIGILGFRTAKEIGLVAKVTNMTPAKIARVLLYDFVNPWAKLAELSSTHPLTGKRLARLDEIAKELGQESIFNIPEILEKSPINMEKLWRDFFTGAYYLPSFFGWLLLPLFFSGWFLLPLFFSNYFFPETIFSIWLILLGLSFLVRTFYRFPQKDIEKTDIFSLMSDPYANPARGKSVELEGRVVGKGIPGYVFSEDMMFEDKSGILYLDYQAGIPIIGNIIFAWKKVREILGQPMKTKGWFFRSNIQNLVIDEFAYNGEHIKSYNRFWGIAIGLLIIIIGIGIKIF